MNVNLCVAEHSAVFRNIYGHRLPKRKKKKVKISCPNFALTYLFSERSEAVEYFSIF